MVLSDWGEGGAARGLFISSVAWLVIAVSLALVLAVKFIFPEFLSGYGFLQFGRVRPVHVNIAAFGWLSMVQVAAVFYIVPKLTKTRLYSERLGNLTVILWNVFLVLAAFTLLMGMTQGREYAELIWPLDVFFLVILGLVAFNVFMTVLRRREKGLYVSLWYFLGSLVWMPIIYVVGNVMWVVPAGALSGVNDAIVNWFYGHNILGLWFTTLGIGAAYYLLPKLVKKPLYSHKLSLIGFWTIGLFYSWVGTHHLIWGPVPYWAQTVSIVASVAMLIPVFSVLWNFWKTLEGRWQFVAGYGRGLATNGGNAYAWSDSLALKFLVLGAAWYLVTCIQGPFQALRSVQVFTHFTNWVVAHAHIALLGAFTFWGFASIYYILPRILGSSFYSRSLGNTHFYLLTIGLIGFFSALTVAGLIQGANWSAGSPFIKVVSQMRPYMVVRGIAAILMAASIYVFAYNFYRTVSLGRWWR